MKNTTIKILTIMLAGLTAVACNGRKEPDTTPAAPVKTDHAPTFVTLTKEQFNAVDIAFGKIGQQNLSTTVRASGHLEVPPQNKAQVSSYVGAVVRSIAVLQGSKVSKGQTLAVLEHPDFIKLQQEYLNEKNSLAFLEKEYERQKELAANDAGTGKMYQRAESEYLAGKSRLNALSGQLRVLSVNMAQLNRGRITSSITLKSPISGYVGKISANTGGYAEPNMPLFEILDNSRIHCDLLVYEKDIFKVKIGQKIHFTLTNMPDHQGEHEGKAIEGEIFGIDKTFEDGSKAIAVHARIKNENHQLIPGMYVNALIDVGQKMTTVVPSDAVFTSDGRQWVFIRNKTTGCKTHRECAAHESCAPSEYCKEHPQCEAHEQCGNERCQIHTDCEAHENCNIERNPDNYYFTMHEVRKGVSDLGFTEVSFVDPVPTDATVVSKGAFYLLSKSRTGGEMEAH
ncbi:efflux RND transporter periplasmic adaptor subunit [Flavobacterium magnum]|uniref:Efflux RND transporter periplasmic adaptor subunit n=1 Tax=Flavobacterium magnum TaxID=2162713 RepID=A0A2S0RBS5_9FLAO|nr:efflux RND transporter periplasmic adaptor subunit [Flavobacterium magnum]AWA28979.1 efflux RND transporter periplasmic adaptor subunit [Flavobacterium magnum]